jgi:hypothetical protein
MKFHVSPDDIRNGTPRSCSHCPVALAIFRKLPYVSHVRVSNFEININDAFYPTPSNVADFIRDFDMHKPVEPFTFELTRK